MKLTSLEIKNSLQSILKNSKIISEHDVWTEWSTDSRQKTKKGLFIALKGDNFDAHQFLSQAYENGCRGFILQADFKSDVLNNFKDISVFAVQETVLALQKISVASSQKLNCLKVAITGTSGKTSTKYFAHQILDGQIEHYFSPKSFNNHIGVPFTLLDLNESHKVGLIEIGMNHPGEISTLTELAEPHVTAVTMVGRGHLEGVGTIENVLKEKMSIYKDNQIHIVNKDDLRVWPDYTSKYSTHTKKKTITVSTKDSTADVYLKCVSEKFESMVLEGHILGFKGKAEVHIAGAHHALNIAIAAAIAQVSGLSSEMIWKQIENIKPVWGRSEIHKTKNNISIYFDAYNANPESMKAFLNQTRKLKTTPYLILGEMLEMGEHSSEVHFELGQLVASTPHQKVWFMGPSAPQFKAGYESLKNGNNLMITNSYEESLAIQYLSMLQPEDWVGLKASRGIGLEKVLNLLLNSF